MTSAARDTSGTLTDKNGRPGPKRTVPVSERIGFTIGDLASNLTWSTVGSYLLYFYTDVALISAAAAGTLLLLARIFDAVIDPLVGVLLDRTNTRFGRAKPYLLFGSPVLAILTLFTFWTPGTHGTFDLVWAYLTFILVGIAYSAVNVPYGALMAMVTRDSKTRMALASFRNVGATGGLLIVSIATTPLVRLLGGGDQQRGWFLTVALYSALGMVFFWIVVKLTKERIPVEQATRARGSLLADLKALVRNRHWVAVFLASLTQFARLGVVTGGAIYVAAHVFDSPDTVGLILLAFSVSGLLSSFVAPVITRIFGQRQGLILSLVVYVVLTLVLALLVHNLLAFVGVFFVASLFGGIGFVALPALVSDSVEYQDFKTGRRNEGLLYSGYSFSTKVGAAVGGAALAWGLSGIGYSAESESSAVSGGIAALFICLPVVLAALQIAALSFYRLEKDLPGITKALEARNSGSTVGE
ncbi:MFS transporter [Amycolatopsis acidicola]|uniref:MFS transporter n=1 Tax=Amycolatopsis acidicola TaxID=2596893 RepID=A0A5N0V5M0_9PSEU|nr:glycoside-pentoside-hexuronide (GPH):cation symporter [Amycolatopsis acidicola]KAA9160688.1 MFS transporter [Amycolatopsis acidicola]